jgi:hypothetical protein
MDAARVTIVGNGRAYVEVRASVLRQFWTVQTVPLDEGALPDLDTDLVVVCHSLPEEERQGWVDRLRQQAPALLIVRMSGYDAGPHLAADATVDESRGPGALVSAIYGLVTERGLRSRTWHCSEEPNWVQ